MIQGRGKHYMEFGLPEIHHVRRDAVLAAVQDVEWQIVRLSLKGISTYDKLVELARYWGCEATAMRDCDGCA